MKFFYDLDAQKKFIIAFGIIIVLMLAVAVTGYKGLGEIGDSMETIYKENYVASVGVARLASELNAVRAQLVVMMGTQESTKLDKQKETLLVITKRIDDGFQKLINNSDFPQDMIIEIKGIKAPWDAFRKTRDEGIIPAIYAGDVKTAKELALGINAERYKKFSSLANEMLAQEEQEALNNISAGRTRSAAITKTFVVGIIIAIALGIIMSTFLARIIAAPLAKLSGAMEKMAEGDLTQRVDDISSKDEVGVMSRAFNKMSANLNDIVAKIKDGSNQIASSSEQISAASEEMSAGADNQTRQTDQVATATEEMSATVLEVARNSNDASEAARKASDVARDGGEIVRKTIEGMNMIASSVKESAKTMEALGKSSDEIGEIIAVIDDIADQTNLLALNAAIEAARAGEQGRGFAVVADEVRKLAERTTKATKEIAAMIKTIQTDTGGAVKSMAAGTVEVEKGVEYANEAGRSLDQIVEVVGSVTEMIQQIATAAEEQSAAAEEISANVESVASITKETSTGARQSSVATQDLSRLATDLKSMMAQFKI